jgi:outer membrane protein TolC
MGRAPTAFMIALSAAFLGTVTSGCTVGPNHTPPKTDLLPFHNLIDASTTGTLPAPPLDRWWVGFSDPILVSVIELSLKQNMDVAAALSRVWQSRAAVAGASALVLPTADLGASSSFEHQSLRGKFGSIAGGVPTFDRDIYGHTIGPVASWEIDLFGGLHRAEAASQAEAQAAEAAEAGTRVIVTADAADAYFSIRGYQPRLSVAQIQIGNNERLLQVVRDRHTAGLAKRYEVSHAEAVLNHARASIPHSGSPWSGR